MGFVASFFRLQTRHPIPFAITLPVILIVLLAVGWTRDDIVEKEVNEIWIRKSGQYHEDKEYAESIRGDTTTKGRSGTSNFAAMAVARDGGSLFTEKRLEEIRKRMEVVEKETKVEYKGNTFTYDDVCASNNVGEGTVYKAPCARLSPLDYFQEAEWFFDEEDKTSWYTNVYQDLIVSPRLERFGALTQICLPPDTNAEWCELNDQPTFANCSCAHTYRLRTDPSYAVEQGYPASFASPFGLFSDIGNLENNDRCKICIERGFDGIISQMLEGMTAMLNLYEAQLQQVATSETSSEESVSRAQEELSKIEKMDLSRSSIEVFNHYYTARGLYGELGAMAYQARYEAAMTTESGGVTLAALCLIFLQDATLCSSSIDLATAKKHLLQHADNVFSSVNAGGLPLPFFGGDETVALFGGTKPFSGSGVDLSGGKSISDSMPGKPLQGLVGYLMPLMEAGGALDFTSAEYQLLATDPMWVWFEASVTDADDVKCSNENIPGTNSGNPALDEGTAAGMSASSPKWCTKYNELPSDTTKQDVAKMWYDLLVDSDSFLEVEQGVTDPYSWTTGQGCNYQLKGQRFSYTGKSDEDILANATGPLYYWDEGEVIGVIDKSVLIAKSTESVLQSVYLTLVPEDIVERVKNCNRPGGPIEGLAADDAQEVLYRFKQQFEEVWSRGWDESSGSEVQFSGFFDDSGSIGTTGRLLDEITLSSGSLMAISFIIIIVFSALFLFSFDVIQSRVLLTIVGVLLVILTFFAALGVAILAGLKMNITVGWTLPFILIGLGVDDMYIVSIALASTSTAEGFVDKMSSVLSPVTMTSMVVFAMFGVMNISDIPAVYVTARCGMISVAFLWLMIICCFPAYVYADILRQNAGRYDMLFCMKKDVPVDAAENLGESAAGGRNARGISGYVYDFVYKPLVVKAGIPRVLFGVIIVLAGSLALLGVSIWGLASETSVGLGLEEFFPDDHQASVWAHTSAEHLAGWSITINWGALDYKDPDVQLKMIKQFEDIVSSPHVAETETKGLWMADFILWTTRHCDDNFSKQNADQRECGMDMTYSEDGSTCTGEWVRNDLGLSNKEFYISGKDECKPLEGGICRPVSQMHYEDLQELAAKGLYDPSFDDANASYCPVFRGESNEKLKWCVERWREHTGGAGSLVVQQGTDSENPTCEGELLTDGEIVSPIPLSKGPIMFGKDLFTHEDTVNLIEETRAFCDDDPETHCWLTGVPYDYWEQYLYVDTLLAEIGGYALLAVFLVSMIFLFLKVGREPEHGKNKAFAGSLVGSLLIALTGLLSLVSVSGLSSLAGVSLTAFSDMAFVLSVGYSTEYSVHILHRWLRSPMHLKASKDRVEYTMEFLFLPTFMSFVSSVIGVICLAFTEFHFNQVYFFRPLIIVMFVTYFYGCYLLPFVLAFLDFDFLKLGPAHYGDQEELLGASKEVGASGGEEGVVEESDSKADESKMIEVPTAVVPEPEPEAARE